MANLAKFSHICTMCASTGLLGFSLAKLVYSVWESYNISMFQYINVLMSYRNPIFPGLYPENTWFL